MTGGESVTALSEGLLLSPSLAIHPFGSSFPSSMMPRQLQPSPCCPQGETFHFWVPQQARQLLCPLWLLSMHHRVSYKCWRRTLAPKTCIPVWETEAKTENYTPSLDLKYSSGEKIACADAPHPYPKPDLSLLHYNPLLLPLYSCSWIICIVLGLIPARGLLCWRLCLQSQDLCHAEL